MPDEKANVVSALAAVVADLPAIGKDSRGPRDQGGYAYRGIEAITREAAPLLAKHGVVFVPHVEAMEIRDLVVNNKPWTDTILTVRYRICGPGGPEDYVEACVVGIGRDNSDKGANKAMTQAFKYALIQTLCISDARDDADGTTHEADARPNVASKLDVDELTARIESTEPSVRDAFVAWKNDQGFPWPWPPAAIVAMHRKLDEIAGTEDEVVTGVSPEPSVPPTLPLEPHGYDLWPARVLAAQCERLGLPRSGNKERLVNELRAWNIVNRPDFVEYDDPDSEPF